MFCDIGWFYVVFWRPFVRWFALSDRCLSCPVLSACDVGVLWTNDKMNQGDTWHAGRPRPWPHCVRWEPAPSPLKEHIPQFSAQICSGQMAGWIKMPLDRKVDLDPSNIVLHGNPAPLSEKRSTAPSNFRPKSIVAKSWLDRSRRHLIWR